MYVKTIALREFLLAESKSQAAKNTQLLHTKSKTPTPEIIQFLRDVDTYDKSGIIDFKSLCYIVPNVTYIACILTASDHYETFVNSGRFSKVLSKWEEYTLEFLKEYLSSSGKSYPSENIEIIANISANIRESIKTNDIQSYIYLSSLKIDTLISEVIQHCYSEFNKENIRRRLVLSTMMLFEKALYS